MTELKEILNLSVNDRIHLVQAIWDSIGEDTLDTDIPEKYKAILDERLKAHEENPSNVLSWEEVKAMSVEELNKRIDLSLEDSKNKRFTEANQLITEIEKWT